MTNLEKYIADHRDEFDSHEPAPAHFDSFKERLKEQRGLKRADQSGSLFLKIAALIVVLITVSVFAFDLATREIRERFAVEDQETKLPLEIREAVQYYDTQTTTQLATLHKLAEKQQDEIALNASALKEIQSIDAAISELKQSFADNPGNEMILDAIIQNQRMKETMLNTIITQLSESKKY